MSINSTGRVLSGAETVINKYDLIKPGDRVVIALSGGADSVTLANVLNSIKEKYNLTLYAAHVNHGLRGAEADNDEKFCKILCENYNIQLFVKHINVAALSREQKISEELCGRNERYAFFEELSEKLGAKIATAHTASDNAETLIFNLSRGASISGASGIPPKRGNIIRPLLELTREEIEAYCAENSLSYVTDSTNLADAYTRNRIRHKVIPELKAVNPAAEQAISSFCEDAYELSAYLNDKADELLNSAKEKYGYDAEILLRAEPVILKAAVVRSCRENGVSPERRHIGLILSALKSGGAVELTKGVTAVCSQGILRFKAESDETAFSLAFDKNKTFSYRGVTYEAKADESVLKNADLTFRTRQSGDSFTFDGRNITKPLRKALNEQKVPSELRDSMLLLCEGSTVLWCEGLGFSKLGREYGITINILSQN